MIYSQNNEQSVILDYFGDFKGSFLDLGANDGETLSNTRALEGWNGICVEPSMNAFKKLSELYKNSRVQCINVAVGEKTGTVNFWDMGNHLGKGDTSLLSTAVESELERWEHTEFEKTQVQMLSVEDLFKRVGSIKFDFISIDCEGLDLAILKQIPKEHVKMICVEYNGKDEQLFINEMTGFKLIHKNAENLIFAK
jgi:FkbM family methyltransferase